MKAVWVILVLLAVFLLLCVAAGYYMYRFAIVRDKKRQRDCWVEEPKPFGDLTEVEFAKIREDVLHIRCSESERITIRSHDGLKLAGHLYPAENPRGLILMSHGYRSSAPFDFSGAIGDFNHMGFTCLLTDQRAHGFSEGKHIGFGVTERYDIVRWAEYAQNRWPHLPVVMDGVSMGAATVMMGCGVGYPENVRAIIADCGYTTPGAICRRTLKRWFKLPPFPVYYAARLFVGLLAGYDLDGVSTVDALKKMQAERPIPVLIAHGKADDFVPCSMSLENADALVGSGLCELFLVENAQHGLAYIRDKAGYTRALERLFDRAGIR